MRNDKGANTVAPTPTTKLRNSTIKQNIRALFLQGAIVTAVRLNKQFGFNDARKVISNLRNEGMNIVDCRLADNRKLYWLDRKEVQYELF